MESLNLLMFQSGVYYAQLYDKELLATLLDDGLESHVSVNGTVTSRIELFVTDYTFFAAAAAVETFTILIILSTFWGFWRLGRNVSLSPLETAKAFNAPIFGDAASNHTAREMARSVGSRRVKYGRLQDEVECNEGTGFRMCDKLGFAQRAGWNDDTGQNA
jgi:hypothetical protein